MITYVKGILTKAEPGFAVIDAGGIGYKIFIPASALQKLPKKGTQAHLHTSLVIREVSQTLYGFPSEEERDLFEKLTSVTGVGPKLALSLIGHLTLEEMHAAISKNDIAAFSKVPGIGKKTAQRLIIDLRDKLSCYSKSHIPSDFAILVENDSHAQKIIDAMNALINLGYNQMTAQKAVKKSLSALPDPVDLPTLITDALKNV